VTDTEKQYVVIVDEVHVAYSELVGAYGKDSPHTTFANACELVKIKEARRLADQISNLNMAVRQS
jgi:hypothetical protein